jgi:hypothetical protein
MATGPSPSEVALKSLLLTIIILPAFPETL